MCFWKSFNILARKESKVNDIYNLVTLSPSDQVVAATVDLRNSGSPPTTKLMITKVEDLES